MNRVNFKGPSPFFFDQRSFLSLPIIKALGVSSRIVFAMLS